MSAPSPYVSIKLPPLPPLKAASLQEIARRHGAHGVRHLPQVDLFNAIYALGDDLALRVPRQHPDFTAAEREAVAVPLARRAGVKTFALVEYDAWWSLIPVPFLVLRAGPRRVEAHTVS